MDARDGALVYTMTMRVRPPLQVEIVAEPPDPDYKTDLVPGPDGMHVQISGLPSCLVHSVRFWDSSSVPVSLGEIGVMLVLQEGDSLSVGPLELN